MILLGGVLNLVGFGKFKTMNIIIKFCFILCFFFLSCSSTQKEKKIMYYDSFIVSNSTYSKTVPFFLRYSEKPFSEDADKQETGLWAELEKDNLVHIHRYTSFFNSDSIVKDSLYVVPLALQFSDLILELEQYSGEVCAENKLTVSESVSRLVIFGNGQNYYTIYWPGDCAHSEFMNLVAQIKTFFGEAKNYAKK